MLQNSLPTAAHELEPTKEPGLQYDLALRMFKKVDDFRLVAELFSHSESAKSIDTPQSDKQIFENHIMVGSYYRLIKNLKMGAFYQLQQGKRHDDDWTSDNGDWFWEDSKKRIEHAAILDLSPRFLLSPLGLSSAVLEIKNRYHYSSYENEQSYSVRPGITWFWMKNREPFINIFFHYEFIFALNYGSKTLREHWPYLGFLYHAGDTLKLGGYIAYRFWNWEESEKFQSVFPGESYGNSGENAVLGIMVILSM